jgi:hypothetical protein
MKRRIFYTTNGGSYTWRDFDISVGIQAAIESLVNDPQEPLCVVDGIELVQEQESDDV